MAYTLVVLPACLLLLLLSELRAGKRFSVGMCSLEGHQLAGEERFAVDMLPDGSVWWVDAGG